MNALIVFALKHRMLMIGMFVLVVAGGVLAFRELNIEAYPDPTPPMVTVITQSPGLSAEEIERSITTPIERQVAGIRDLRNIRSTSLYGLSTVSLQFTFGSSYEEALQQVLNRLSSLPPLLNGAQPEINPMSPTGEIYRYKLLGPPDYSVLDLKTLQDWVLERRFRMVPGVIDVIAWGGKTKTFELEVDFNKLVAYGITLPQLIQTLNNSNVNVGGNTVNIGAQAAVVRGVGLIRSVDELADTMLAQVGGNPVFVRDVAAVKVGHQPRLGIAGADEIDDTMQGIVLMRRGEKSMPVIQRVEAEVQRINESGVLPPGVRLERVYTRKDLVEVTTSTVLHNMAFGIALVALLQWVFLGNLRSAVIVGATIPFALLFAVGILALRGESANLLSVGAIDFGLIVDSTVIMVEAIFRGLSQPFEQRRFDPVDGLGAGVADKLSAIYHSATSVSQSILFSAAVIVAAFIPLFTLSGVEGHIFGPMAKTYAYALAGGLIATFTITPALCAFLLPAKVDERETWIVRSLSAAYLPALRFALANRVIALAAAAGVLATVMIAGQRLGLEFMPKLEEGNLLIRATLPATISLDEGNGYINRIRRTIGAVPEVETVVSQHGRPDDGTEPTGFFNAEFLAPLKPKDRWRRGLDKESLMAEILASLSAEFPGVGFNFSQYLQDNVAEAISGVKGENSIKLFGNDLTALAETADAVKARIENVPGVKDLGVFVSLGQPTIQIDIDRLRAARYGLTPGDINATIRAAIGGEAAGNLYEPGSDRFFPIVVRLAPQFRQSPEAIRNLRIAAPGPNGLTQIPLNEVANVTLTTGPAYIYRENQQRYLPIKFSVRERDLGSTIREAQENVASGVRLPPGSRTEWVGEFGNLQDAIARLKVLVPISLGLIALLLFLNFGSAVDTLLAMSVIPMGVVGGVLALAATGIPFSVSAAIGFIAVFGVAVMNGILVLSQYNRLIDAGLDRHAALVRTGERQMRPVLMTCVIAGVGLLPAAVSTGIGSQVQRPLAVAVVGGMALAPAIILMTLPVLISIFSLRGRPAAAAGAAADATRRPAE